MASASDSEYQSVCLQLDDLAVQILNMIQNLILERQYLNDNLKEGFINMAKSRYLMRGRNINMLQINTADMHASKKVISNSNALNGIQHTSFEIFEGLKLKEETLDDHSNSDPDTSPGCLKISDEHKDENISLEDESNSDGLVRLRNLKITDDHKNEEPYFVEDQDSHSTKSPTSENPLHWFGVLVPETLKKCQNRFEQVIHTSAKIASLQNQIKALCEEYRILRKKKHSLHLESRQS